MSNLRKVTPVLILVLLIHTGCFQDRTKDTIDSIEKQVFQDEKSKLLPGEKKVKYTVYSGEIANESGVSRESGLSVYEMENPRTYTVKVVADLAYASINDGPFTNLIHDKDNVYLFTQGAMMGLGISITPNHVTMLNYDGSTVGIVYKTEDIYE